MFLPETDEVDMECGSPTKRHLLVEEDESSVRQSDHGWKGAAFTLNPIPEEPLSQGNALSSQQIQSSCCIESEGKLPVLGEASEVEL